MTEIGGRSSILEKLDLLPKFVSVDHDNHQSRKTIAEVANFFGYPGHLSQLSERGCTKLRELGK